MIAITDTQKIEVLNKIISSSTFSNSEQYITLLKYLVQSEIKKVTVKEYTIGVEIFNKDKDFDPSHDPSVRTNMHRLRNKIISYYEAEGKKDKIKLTIPKGHYEIKFISEPFIKENLIGKKFPHFLLLLSLIIAFISIYFFFSKTTSDNNHLLKINEPIQKDDPIWSSFFSNRLPTTVVIGDHFQFVEYNNDSSKIRQIIDFSITSNNEFESYAKKNLDKKLSKNWHGGLPANAVWNFYDLVHVLYSFNQQVNIELSSLFMASKFDLTNIADRNIIYMGGFNNLREFNNIFDKLPIEYHYTDIFKGILKVRNPDTDSTITFIGEKLINNYHRDIGVIAKLPGTNNENYLFFIGFAFPSQIETVRLLSRNNLLSKVYSQTNRDKSTFPEHFIMIIEVYCTDFSAIETNVKYFQEISSKL